MKNNEEISVCPVTGYTIENHPGWIEKIVENYTYSFRKIGDSIIYVANSGEMGFFNIETHYQLLDAFAKETNVQYPIVEIRDIKHLKGIPPAHVVKNQKEYLLANQEKMAGYIFCNAPFWMRAVAAAGMKRYQISTQMLVCKNDSEALTKAKRILEDGAVFPESRQGTYGFDMLEFRPQWQFEDANRKISFTNGVIPGKIFFSSVQADDFGLADFYRMSPFLKQVFEDGILANSRYIRILDYSRFNKVSLNVRKEYARLWVSLNTAYDCSASITYICGANLFARTAAKVFSRILNQKFVFVDRVELAFDEINHRLLKEDDDQTFKVSKKDIEEINDLCGLLLLDENEFLDGEATHISANNPLSELYETISLVRNDLFDLRCREIEQAKKLKNALRMAEAANQAKSDFLGNMSHELRTPLNGIVGMLDLVSGENLSSEQKERIASVKASADHLQELLVDILDFIRLEDATVAPVHENFDLCSVMDTINEPLAKKAQEKKIQYVFSMDKDVPQNLSGDPASLFKLMTHIIGNAVKFVEKGSVTISISKQKETDDTVQVLFEVTDTGIGIPRDKQDILFDLFTQADTSTTRSYEGAGIGLSISKKLVDFLGGKIGFDSRVGKGSRFWIKIVYKKQRLLDSSHDGKKEKVPKRAPSGIKRAMVVDDNKVNQKIVSIMLKEMGYQVLTADNGREAVEKYHPGMVDLILMDIQMPVMGGEEAVKQIRQIEEKYHIHTPIIALTANTTRGSREKFLDAGMDEYMTKPLKKDMLIEKIRQVV